MIRLGDFTLNSGTKSKYKIECDDLSDETINGFAYLISIMVGDFCKVVSVPRGGDRVAKALEKYLSLDEGKILIVDDVLTTGNSIKMKREEIVDTYNTSYSDIVGAVMYARGPCPYWVKAVNLMNECFWRTEHHPHRTAPKI